jgi:hypothetical protein
MPIRQGPKNKPSRAEWDSLRVHIIRYYIEENKPLLGIDGLIQLMERNYGFSAR